MRRARSLVRLLRGVVGNDEVEPWLLHRAMSWFERHRFYLMPDVCEEVNRLEDVADQVSRRAIASLFDTEKDPIQLIKFKELFEVLETATDKAEDAANVLEAIVLKSA